MHSLSVDDEILLNEEKLAEIVPVTTFYVTVSKASLALSFFYSIVKACDKKIWKVSTRVSGGQCYR